MYKNPFEKIIEIYNRSHLSISKFAKIANKDRRTMAGWIDRTASKEPNESVKRDICHFFRYPYSIWDEDCNGDDFLNEITKLPKEEIKIVDFNYADRLRYILSHEEKERFVINPQFPGPVYRDTAAPLVNKQSSKEAENLKSLRSEHMLCYSYESVEWYPIKALLNFCFSDIGNFYTREDKIKILDLMYETFHNNYNKSLFFFDSYSRKIYGVDTAYTSIDHKKTSMFFKAPLESVFIEIRNKKIIERIHRHFTYIPEAPHHTNRLESTNILLILKRSIEQDLNLEACYEIINKETDYAALFYNALSPTLKKKVSKPKEGQRRN
ncbi:MAG: hypothetical protein OIF32_06470 [Campylobacterales bacterium]|nr:hypothetical protein [Campylobacterales bacterium]